jgi:PLP dependent protein
MVESIGAALASVRDRMESAARKAGRAPSEVRLMAVTKNFPRATVDEALAVGLDLFGENRVQEAEEKYAGLQPGPELHLIGHLQRNKAKLAAGVFSCVQSIDKQETAQALSGRCVELGRTMDILLELNTSGEQSKSGFHSPDELRAALGPIAALPGLRLRGLMTVGPLTTDERSVRASFAALKRLFDELRAERVSERFDVLSMGMSGDFAIAIEEGSTLVRIGTALFGTRVYA